ncbi:class I adenylate-forming enzyme family protein [Aerosticca soli]|jgi:long-chain acyl-CoA synthetase|uniref:class I adenylate-forming enzyme family protein n=1 Tax=Aerosticca soli TaxID=2010829 RepID=UPI000F83570D|nr:AMP-binding protein [Aerosticca soli]MDI3262172.1 AMP-binding protein [Fulvimonas sp.]
MDVGNVLRQRAVDRADHPALLFHDEQVSFAELDRRTESVRHQLLDLGIGPGDAVGMLLPNTPAFVYLYLALLRIGAIPTPIDVRLGAAEVTVLARHCRLRLAFVAPDYAHRDVLSAHVRTLDTDALRLDLPPPAAATRPYDPAATALYLHTSGTTGIPKVVELTLAHLDCYPHAMSRFWHSGPDWVLAMILPMSHISGPILINEMLDKGSTLAIVDRISGPALLEAAQRYRFTFMHGVPPIFQMMLTAEPERYDLSSVKVMALMGTSVPVTVMRALKTRLPHVKVLQGYGLTETSPLLTGTPSEAADDHLDSIGIAVPDAEVFIADAQGRPLPPGEVGEIVARGKVVMKGYLDNPAATAARIRNGVLHTGDAGRQDEHGFFYHLGRMDDQIVTRQGLNVYPAEVENVLLGHPQVLDAAVVGQVDDAEHGTVLTAYVIPRGAAPAASELRRYCLDRLAQFKVPQRFHFVTELPRTGTGKVARERLRG